MVYIIELKQISESVGYPFEIYYPDADPEAFRIVANYRIEQNFGGKKFWQNCDIEMLAEKTLANPRLACILIIVRARQL